MKQMLDDLFFDIVEALLDVIEIAFGKERRKEAEQELEETEIENEKNQNQILYR